MKAFLEWVNESVQDKKLVIKFNRLNQDMQAFLTGLSRELMLGMDQDGVSKAQQIYQVLANVVDDNRNLAAMSPPESYADRLQRTLSQPIQDRTVA